MAIMVYPNGRIEKRKGNVSIFLENKSDASLTVKCKFTTDVVSMTFNHTIEANNEWGWAGFFSHDKCGDVYQDKDFVVTVDVEISDDTDLEIIGRKTPEVPKKFNVWENVYTNMERTDFTFVFNGEDVPCHKHILAAASPVLRAMVENQHKEAIESKANIDLSEEVGRAFIRFIYTGGTGREPPQGKCSCFPGIGGDVYAAAPERYSRRRVGDAA